MLALAFTLAWLDCFQPGGRAPGWLAALTAGLCLGLLALTRPFTAVALAAPFAVHGIWIALRGPVAARHRLAMVALPALGLSLVLPLWQYAVTGDPLTNPYTLWWPYDRVGFGPGIGVTGEHTPGQAWNNTRLSLYAGSVDLFGWAGLSYALLPFGLIALACQRAAWLVAAIPFALVAAYMLYWIGAWLFGPRYYFEALPSAALLSAAGAGWLAGQPHISWWSRARFVLTGLVVGLLVAGNLIFYLPGRLASMKGLYQVHAEDLAPFLTPEARRLPPTLVIVYARRDWIEYGRLLDLASPALDSHFIFILNQGEALNKQVIRSFPERFVWPYDPERPPQPASQPQ